MITPPAPSTAARAAMSPVVSVMEWSFCRQALFV
jgi:hypothetical protein